MGVVAFVLSSCATREEKTLVTAPSVKTLRSVLGFIEELFPETLESAKLEFSGYLEFLDESDEFSGSDQLFEDLYDLVNDIDEDEFGALDSLAGPIPTWAGHVPVATQPPAPGVQSVRNLQGPVTLDASTSASGANPQTVYRLKIELDGSMPPVWRQVEVPAEIDLGELHWLIQSCFRWDNRHPHLFEAGRPGSGFHRIYRDGNDDRDSGLPAAIQCDEATKVLGDVLKDNRKTLRYVYDFDDNWQHTITLESAFPDTEWSGKVRCIDGEGRAPEEGSGGIWGWMDALDAAFAPEHPMHQEYCDLLGIDSGDYLDVAVFTSEQRTRVNENLAKEFGD